MPTSLKNEAAIVGIGETAYSKNSGVSDLSLACEAVSAAIADCGVDPKEIDGFVTYDMDMSDCIEVARAVGCGNLTFESRMPYGAAWASASANARPTKCTRCASS